MSHLTGCLILPNSHMINQLRRQAARPHSSLTRRMAQSLSPLTWCLILPNSHTVNQFRHQAASPLLSLMRKRHHRGSHLTWCLIHPHSHTINQLRGQAARPHLSFIRERHHRREIHHMSQLEKQALGTNPQTIRREPEFTRPSLEADSKSSKYRPRRRRHPQNSSGSVGNPGNVPPWRKAAALLGQSGSVSRSREEMYIRHETTGHRDTLAHYNPLKR